MVSKTFSFPRSNFIGFDHLLNEIERLSAFNDQSFPKHNVVKYNEAEYAIQLALAGYNKENITVELKDGNLVVSGERSKNDDVEYLHQGISAKQFSRTFKLSDQVVVGEADFEDGLLIIKLKVLVPEEKRPRVIPIGGAKQLLTED